MDLGELLQYQENLANDNKDYSPANQVYENKAVNDTTIVNLYKEQTSQILEAKVFSDLKGVNAENPNGLVQVEVSKKFNFWSVRFPGILGFFKRLGKHFNSGFFNYITPQLSINKIENNQKNLIPNYIDTLASAHNDSTPLTYTSRIKLFSRQTFTVGLDLSVFLIDVLPIKSTFNFGIGFNYGIVPIQDTIREFRKNRFQAVPSNNLSTYDVNTFSYGGFANWQIFPNSKYGISITGRIFKYNALTSQFLQVRDSTNFAARINAANGDRKIIDSYASRQCLASFELFAFFKPSANNKLFFRYRLTQDIGNVRENFRQIQVGFSTYLTSTKELSGQKKSGNAL